MKMTPEFIQQCIDDATQLQSKCTPEVLAIEGMSSAKVRHLLNNVCNHPGAKYLEIGVWKGATFCAALYGNSIASLAVDNFSEFGGTRDQFISNFESTIGRSPELLRMDFRNLRPSHAGRFNILFYDGSHSYDDQRVAVVGLSRVLEPEFLMMVDDWNWPQVRSGTWDGIRQAQISVVASWELTASSAGDTENWWNGLFVALCRRPVSLSIVIPSVGRESLAWTLEGIREQASPQDEVIVVFDKPTAEAQSLVDVIRNVRWIQTLILPNGPRNDFGAAARMAGIRMAKGDFIAFIDDDDLYLPGALATIHRATSEEPARPHLFRMSRHPHGGDIWGWPGIHEGNVSTQMFVTPNIPSRLGQWTSRYCGDYDFIRSTVSMYWGSDWDVVWHDDVIAHWNGNRGRTGTPWSAPGLTGSDESDPYPNNYQIPSEIDELAGEVAKRNPRSILEIGSLEGYTLSRWFDAVSPGARIVSIDLPVPNSDSRFGIQFAGHRGRWGATASRRGHAFCMLSGSSRDSNLILLAEANAPFQFIFIDGDHSYDGVRSDWLTYFPMLADGGIIAFHDIGVNEPYSGVNRLWNEIKGAFAHREILHCPDGTKGLGIIEK